jgi:hypothetical protein
LIDTHSNSPPTLRIEINGQAFDRETPEGGGDDSIAGRLSKAKPFRFSVPFPSKVLKAGNNEIRISNVKGSWILYDWAGLFVPVGAELAPVTSHTVVEEVKAVRALREVEGRLVQPVVVRLRHYGRRPTSRSRSRDSLRARRV